MVGIFSRHPDFSGWRQRLLHLILACTLIGWVGLAPNDASAITIYSGSIDGSSQTMANRPFRDAVASTCASVKAYPGQLATANTQYNVVNYTHTGPSRCVTLTYSTGTCATGGFLTIYNGTFNPSDLSVNYLGDIGSSTVGATAGVFLTTGQAIQFVLSGTSAGRNCTVSVDSDDPSTMSLVALDGSAPTMTDRIMRNGVPSTCASVKTYPGLNAGTAIQYRSVSYTNTGGPRCVTFTVAGGTCGLADFFLSVYSGPFDPANKATNYLADAGSSGYANPSATAAVSLAAGQTVNLVINGTKSGLNCSLFVNADGPVGAKHDFNADGKSDILWRNTDGFIVMWLMSGASATTVASLGNGGASWSPVGQRDFNGDGKTDILWRDTSGNIAMWLMNGVSATSTASLGNIGANWSVSGTGDFNGDGKGDILWRNNDGSNAIWLMNGTSAIAVASLGYVPTNWSVVGTADFNGDGKTDILWRNSDGANVIWLMNGTSVSSVAAIGGVATNWSVAGTADFDGDGNGDIMWRNTDGSNAIWFMNGTTVASVSLIGGVGATWSVASNGDYNGDGKGDILWREAGGTNAVWLMNGKTVSSVALIGGVANNWSVQNAGAN